MIDSAGNEKGPHRSEESASKELSPENAAFIKRIKEAKTRMLAKGHAEDARNLMKVLLMAGQELWKRMQAGDVSASLPEIWDVLYEQQEAKDSSELRRAIMAFIEIGNEDKEQIKVTKEQATRDSLTGLLNRRQFSADMFSFVEKFKQSGEEFCLVMMDMDNLKQINDGPKKHLGGDEALQTLANILTGIKLLEGDRAYRIGGDEFALLLVTDLSKAKDIILPRIRNQIAFVNQRRRKQRDTNTLEFDLSVSIGVAAASEFGVRLTPEEIYLEADKRMDAEKKAKGTGRK